MKHHTEVCPHVGRLANTDISLLARGQLLPYCTMVCDSHGGGPDPFQGTCSKVFSFRTQFVHPTGQNSIFYRLILTAKILGFKHALSCDKEKGPNMRRQCIDTQHGRWEQRVGLCATGNPNPCSGPPKVTQILIPFPFRTQRLLQPSFHSGCLPNSKVLAQGTGEPPDSSQNFLIPMTRLPKVHKEIRE